MAVDQQPARFGRVAAESQDGFDIGFLRQQNVSGPARSHRESAASRESADRKPGRLPGLAIPGRGSTEYG